MLIKKNSLELDVEQKSNEDMESILEDIKSIYSFSKGEVHNKKIHTLKDDIESIKKEIENKNILLERSRKIKKEFNKNIQDIELKIYQKREELLNGLGKK